MRRGTLLAALSCASLPCALLPVSQAAAASHPGVILVCANTPGIGCPAQWDFRTIQDAVDHAKPNDWILVWPGDYRETGPPNLPIQHSAGLWIDAATGHGAPGIFLRGMDRNLVMIDGTRSGPECSSNPIDQNLGPNDPSNGNQPAGRDGLVVWKTEGTWLENFSACNFVTSSAGRHGNQIWWNGGDGSGHVGLHSYWGDYLTATSTYAAVTQQHPEGGDNPRGEYGIFSSNTGNGTCFANGRQVDGTEVGPGGNCYTGFMNHSYANNMGDAAYYIGACRNCSQVLENSHGQTSALGFSGTNAGGDFIIRTTEFDNNKTGLTSNAQNNDDQPSPQFGSCVAGVQPPVAGAVGCTVFELNNIHDNNNINVPGVGSGLSGGAPVGTGIVLGGTRFVTLFNNQVSNNMAWGVLVSDEPDQEEIPTDKFPKSQDCKGGVRLPQGTPPNPQEICWYQAFGNATIGNVFLRNGGYHNATNGDIGLIEPLGVQLPPPYDKLGPSPDDSKRAGNCFRGNTDPANPNGYLKSDPPPFPASETPSNALQQPSPVGWGTCGVPNSGNSDPILVGEAACDTQLLTPCPSLPVAANYPRPTHVQLMSLAQTAAQSPTMNNPCGADSWGNVPPPNPWCVDGVYTGPSSKPPAAPSGPSGGVSASTQPGLPVTGGRGSLTAPAVSGMRLLTPLPLAVALVVALRGRRSSAPAHARRRAGPPWRQP